MTNSLPNSVKTSPLTNPAMCNTNGQQPSIVISQPSPNTRHETMPSTEILPDVQEVIITPSGHRPLQYRDHYVLFDAL